MDFTITTYRKLLETLLRQGFSFQTFADFLMKPGKEVIILRHDVDRLPENSLVFAKAEAEMGIRGTYYFRTVPESWNERIIVQIAEMEHEIGYHYEDVCLAGRKKYGVGSSKYEVSRMRYVGEENERLIMEFAIKSFECNLEKLRQIVSVKTVCMHGSPLSRWDNRLLWKYYDYRDFGIIGEPYFDLDFEEVLYLTDTGRRWDGDYFNIRDKSFNRKGNKVDTKKAEGEHTAPFFGFRSTFDIIKAAEAGLLPSKIMMTFHPQRWTDKPMAWVRELVLQNVKNIGKFFIVRNFFESKK